jgi:hypothetical protein
MAQPVEASRRLPIPSSVLIEGEPMASDSLDANRNQ